MLSPLSRSASSSPCHSVRASASFVVAPKAQAFCPKLNGRESLIGASVTLLQRAYFRRPHDDAGSVRRRRPPPFDTLATTRMTRGLACSAAKLIQYCMLSKHGHQMYRGWRRCRRSSAGRSCRQVASIDQSWFRPPSPQTLLFTFFHPSSHLQYVFQRASQHRPQ